MTTTLGLTRTHWQQRLGAIKRLYLPLFVYTDHERLVRRVELTSNIVPYLLDKLWIRRKSECFNAMRLEKKGAPDAVN